MSSTSQATPIKRFSNVQICGGTHGNELTGVFLVKHWQKNPEVIERNSFKTHLSLCNTKAIERCVRYVDSDLNREPFKAGSSPSGDSYYEARRAQELVKTFTDKRIDFLLDLHSTNSNMGVTLIVQPCDSRAIILQFVAAVQASLPFPIRVLILPDPPMDARAHGDTSTNGLSSFTNCTVGIEIGPLPHGTLRAEVFQLTQRVTYEFLNLIDEFNNGRSFPETHLEVFKMRKPVHFLRDQNGEVTCLIHPKLEGRDWEPLQPGSPVFVDFNGVTVVEHTGPEVTWPLFINEAAYFEYKKDIAFWESDRMILQLPASQ